MENNFLSVLSVEYYAGKRYSSVYKKCRAGKLFFRILGKYVATDVIYNITFI